MGKVCLNSQNFVTRHASNVLRVDDVIAVSYIHPYSALVGLESVVQILFAQGKLVLEVLSYKMDKGSMSSVHVDFVPGGEDYAAVDSMESVAGHRKEDVQLHISAVMES